MSGSLAKGRLRLRLTGSSALALSTVLTNLIRIISTVCLTRLLSPAVYGITGIILSIFYIINLLSDIGLQAYVVRHHLSDEPEFISAVWTIHAGRGILLTATGVLLAWPLSALLAKPELTAPLAVSSLVFMIDGLISLNQFRALREGRVQRFAMMDLVTSVSQTVAAIILAFLLRNIWAIVGSMLIASVARVWASFALFPGIRHRVRRDRNVAADMWRFSRVIAVSSALTLVLTQFDKLAMSRILPLSQFGTYIIAATLASAPTAFAYNYSSSIVYPAIAETWRTKGSLRETYYRCWGRFFYLYAFGGGALIGGAGLLIRILYDPRYLPAAAYLSVLAISTTLTMLTRSMEAVQVASGQQRTAVELNVVRVIWLFGGGSIALVRNDPMTFVITIGLIEIPAYAYAACRMARFRQISLGREISLALTIGLGFAAGTGARALGGMLLGSL